MCSVALASLVPILAIGGSCLSTIFPARTMFSCRAFASCNFLCSSATFNFNFADFNLRSRAVASCGGVGRSVLAAISIGAKFANGGGVSVVVSPGRILEGGTIFDGSGLVIDVAAVTLLDGPSVKRDDRSGRLIKVSLTNGATFPKGPGVLVVNPPATLLEVPLVLIPIVVAVTFGTGPGDLEGSGSVKDVEGGTFFDGSGRLIKVSLTNGATFPKGPGVLV